MTTISMRTRQKLLNTWCLSGTSPTYIRPQVVRKRPNTLPIAAMSAELILCSRSKGCITIQGRVWERVNCNNLAWIQTTTSCMKTHLGKCIPVPIPKVWVPRQFARRTWWRCREEKPPTRRNKPKEHKTSTATTILPLILNQTMKWKFGVKLSQNPQHRKHQW